MATKKPYGMKEATRCFLNTWALLSEVVDYDLEWQHPLSTHAVASRAHLPVVTYSLKGIQEDPLFNNKPYGYIAKSMDDHGRKLIVVKTRLGLIVLWNEATDHQFNSIVAECTPALLAYGVDLRLGERGVILSLIGSPDPGDKAEPGDVSFRNIGEWMEEIFKMMSDPTYRPSRRDVRLKRDYKEKQDGT